MNKISALSFSSLSLSLSLFSLLFFSGCFFSDEIVEKNEAGKITEQNEKVQTCDIGKLRRVVTGNSMQPMIEHQDFIWLYPDFYKQCEQTPKKGDLVAYDYKGRNIPIIKKVIATSEDVVQIKNEKLWVNGEEIKNSAEQAYSFSKAEQKMLVMSAKENHIPENAILILGDNIHNSQDSRKFGAIGISDLLGKFEIYGSKK